jgi:hypothetical protein
MTCPHFWRQLPIVTGLHNRFIAFFLPITRTVYRMEIYCKPSSYSPASKYTARPNVIEICLANNFAPFLLIQRRLSSVAEEDQSNSTKIFFPCLQEARGKDSVAYSKGDIAQITASGSLRSGQLHRWRISTRGNIQVHHQSGYEKPNQMS